MCRFHVPPPSHRGTRPRPPPAIAPKVRGGLLGWTAPLPFVLAPLVFRSCVPPPPHRGTRPRPPAPRSRPTCEEDPYVEQRPRRFQQPLWCVGLASCRCRGTVRGLYLLLRTPPILGGGPPGCTAPLPFLPTPLVWQLRVPPPAPSRNAASTSSEARPLRVRNTPRLDSAFAVSTNPSGVAASRPAATASLYVASTSCVSRFQRARAFPRLISALSRDFPPPLVWKPRVPPLLHRDTRPRPPAPVAPNP